MPNDYQPSELSLLHNAKVILEFEHNYNDEVTPQLLIFSEIYYPKGWNVYLDDNLSEYFDVNYILRAMLVPEGKHKIDFYFEPEIVKSGINVRLISILLTFSFIAYMFYKKTKK